MTLSCNCGVSDMVTVVDIEMFAGNTKTIVLDLRSGSEQFELPQNGSIRFGAKKSRTDSILAVSVTVGPESRNPDGHYEVPLAVSDTAELSEGQYRYDIGVKWDGKFVTVVEGILTIRTSIASYEE